MGFKRRQKAVFSCILPLAPPKPGERGRVQGEDSDWGWPWLSLLPMTLLSTDARVSCGSGAQFHGKKWEPRGCSTPEGNTSRKGCGMCPQGRSGAGRGRLVRGGWSPQDTTAEGGRWACCPWSAPFGQWPHRWQDDHGLARNSIRQQGEDYHCPHVNEETFILCPRCLLSLGSSGQSLSTGVVPPYKMQFGSLWRWFWELSEWQGTIPSTLVGDQGW